MHGTLALVPILRCPEGLSLRASPGLGAAGRDGGPGGSLLAGEPTGLLQSSLVVLAAWSKEALGRIRLWLLCTSCSMQSPSGTGQ